MSTNTLQAFLDELASKGATDKQLILNVPKHLREQTLPAGWKSLIHDFFTGFNEIRNDWLMEQFREEWGSLCIELTRASRSVKQENGDSLVLHYALKSQKTCMYCGERGKRHIVDNRVVVSCARHKRNMSKSIETGTWLDKY